MENKNMETRLATISVAIEKFGMTARLSGNTINLYSRGKLAGTVSEDGTIERKYEGQRALMGAIVRDAIKAALAANVVVKTIPDRNENQIRYEFATEADRRIQARADRWYDAIRDAAARAEAADADPMADPILAEAHSELKAYHDAMAIISDTLHEMAQNYLLGIPNNFPPATPAAQDDEDR